MDSLETIRVCAGVTSSARWLALGAIVVSSLVLGLDSTIIVTALPTLSIELGASTTQLQWISTAYLLALAGFLIPAGALGDRIGRRRVLMLALASFAVSSVAASQVATAGGLILMRALMGLSGAFVMPISMALVPIIFSETERPRAIAIGGAGMFLGLPLGPLVAGWLLTHFVWGSIFLINVPIVLIALLGVWLFVPESRDSTSRPIDFVGAALAICGVTALVYGVIEEPSLGWTDTRIVAATTSGATMLACFTVWELRSASPLIDMRLFANMRFSWAIVVSALLSFTLTGMLFVLTPFLQVVLGNDAQATGVRLLPLIAGIVLGALVSDRLLAGLGGRITIALGLFVSSAGLLLASSVDSAAGFEPLLLALPAIGVGNAIAMFTSINVIFGVLPESQMGAGSALTRALGQIGSSFGVAVIGSLLNRTNRSAIAVHVGGMSTHLRGVAEDSVAGAALVSSHLPSQLSRPLLFAAGDAYSAGMSGALRVSAVLLAVMGCLVLAFMPWPDRLARHRARANRAARADLLIE